MPDTGAPYFIPYVEATDLVRDYPAANEAMALAIVAALEDIPVTIKKVEAFTGDGTFTVPAGVTYAIAHMRGGGGGVGSLLTGSDGGDSSVAFASGTVTGPGASKVASNAGTSGVSPVAALAGKANTGESATRHGTDSGASALGTSRGASAALFVAGAAVTPAAEITVVVGAGGAAGTGQGNATGGSGYVYIEYFEEV